ncbi:hypothetical protein HMPREF3213_03086 [Heyndrickxia coagulans]|uniref:Uncharacterized protein n=1 Tax=Heyndrickxia coagulans TaxID=1398 RepID=A0A133KFE5_HEYCO|nr:hypothetical protein HMPREF3213_03086 [Heyndrickxia coagulans]
MQAFFYGRRSRGFKHFLSFGRYPFLCKRAYNLLFYMPPFLGRPCAGGFFLGIVGKPASFRNFGLLRLF